MGLDELFDAEVEKFASNPENYGAIYQMAKSQKEEIEKQIKEYEWDYSYEIEPIQQKRADEISKGKPDEVIKKEEELKHARKMSVATRFFWQPFFEMLFLCVCCIIVFNKQLTLALGSNMWIIYVLAGVIPIAMGILSSAIIHKRWQNTCNNIINSEVMVKWGNKQTEIIDKYKAQIEEIYNSKYRNKIESLKQELVKKTEFYENIRQVYIQYKYKGTVFIYFESMKHSWTQDWCACSVYIDGNTVYYTKREQLFFVKLNPGYHSVQIEMSAKLSDGINSYTYSYQLSPENCPQFFVFDKFDLYGNVRAVNADEFEKITGTELLN